MNFEFIVRKAFKTTLWDSKSITNDDFDSKKELNPDFLSEIKTTNKTLSFYGITEKHLAKDIVFGVSLATELKKPSSDGFLISKEIFQNSLLLDTGFKIVPSKGGLPINSLNQFHFDLYIPSASALTQLGIFLVENLVNLEKIAIRKDDYQSLLKKYDEELNSKIKNNILDLLK
jgi:hypothetical protein